MFQRRHYMSGDKPFKAFWIEKSVKPEVAVVWQISHPPSQKPTVCLITTKQGNIPTNCVIALMWASNLNCEIKYDTWICSRTLVGSADNVTSQQSALNRNISWGPEIMCMCGRKAFQTIFWFKVTKLFFGSDLTGDPSHTFPCLNNNYKWIPGAWSL